LGATRDFISNRTYRNCAASERLHAVW
jgi:hypothetical protein